MNNHCTYQSDGFRNNHNRGDTNYSVDFLINYSRACIVASVVGRHVCRCSDVIKRVSANFVQWFYEHTPLEFVDLYRQRTLFTDLAVPKGSLGYYGRLGTFVTKMGIGYNMIFHGKDILTKTKAALGDILHGESPRHDLDGPLISTMMFYTVGVLLYYVVVKKHDARQEHKWWKDK